MKELLSRRKGTLVLLVILGVVMAWSYAQTLRVPAHFQRAFFVEQKSDADTEAVADASSPLRDIRIQTRTLSENLKDSCDAVSLYAVSEPASVASDDENSPSSASARLLGVDESYYAMRSFTLLGGRLIYPDEYQNGERVAMLDEQLAVELFQYAEPTGRSIVYGDEKFEIVGILRSAKQVGTATGMSVYIPYRALEMLSESISELVYEATPKQGAGGWVSFQSLTATLGESGTTINLSKERTSAGLPQRVLVCLLGMVACVSLIRRAAFHVKQIVATFKERLVDTYAVKLMPWLIVRALGMCLWFAACVAALACLFVWLIDPVYTFPEWIPAILVEPKDIATAFWNVWQAAATLVEVRTAELVRLRFLRELGGWATGFAAFVCAWVMVKPQVAKVKENKEDSVL